MPITVSKLAGCSVVLALSWGSISLWGCRPVTTGVPAGPATQPSQAEGEKKEEYPGIPEGLIISPDSLVTIAPPNSPEVYYRTLVHVAFDDTTSAPTVHRVLAQFGSVVGGDKAAGPRGTYLVQVADRGADWNRVSAMLDSLKSEPGVAKAGLLPKQPKP